MRDSTCQNILPRQCKKPGFGQNPSSVTYERQKDRWTISSVIGFQTVCWGSLITPHAFMWVFPSAAAWCHSLCPRRGISVIAGNLGPCLSVCQHKFNHRCFSLNQIKDKIFALLRLWIPWVFRPFLACSLPIGMPVIWTQDRLLTSKLEGLKPCCHWACWAWFHEQYMKKSVI